MATIEKFLGLAGVGSSIVNFSLLRRFLAGIALIVALTVISSSIAGAFLIAGFYGLYLCLMYYGVAPPIAAASVCSLAFLLALAFAILAYMRWQQLRDMPQLFFIEKPYIQRIGELADEFISGLLAERSHRR